MENSLTWNDNENYVHADTYERASQALCLCLLSGSCCSSWFAYRVNPPSPKNKRIKNLSLVKENGIIKVYSHIAYLPRIFIIPTKPGMNRFILIVSLLVTACNTPGTGGIAAADSAAANKETSYTPATPVTLNGCYTSAVARDTVTMKLSAIGDSVTGKLTYHLYQKDRNSGTIKGVRKDSLLVADYTFQSEGMTSVREVVFKIKDSVLLEGFGPVYTSGDTVRFKNKDGLQFQNDRPFKKVDCNE